MRAGRPRREQRRRAGLPVEQRTGEDWTGVTLTLSTAQPMLNAAPPDLKSLEVSVVPAGTPGQPVVVAGEQGDQTKAYQRLQEETRGARAQAQGRYNMNDLKEGAELLNAAAAREQAWDLITGKEAVAAAPGFNEGPTVT